MPRYTPTAEEEELYGSPETAVAPPEGTAPPEAETETEEPSETVDEEEAQAESAVVPNSILTGPDGVAPKDGDEIVVKVVKNFGDESEVVYAPKASETSETTSADEEISALDTEM